jgi:dethiobiotin synthetase
VLHGAREAAVAEAAARLAGTSAVRAVALGDRDAPALHAFPTVASPVTAARHAGEPIDPAELVQRLRESAGGVSSVSDVGSGLPESAGGAPLVASVAGGLLAPLTPRYAVRDLARDLGLPLVLAAPAGPDAVNAVRLSAESARGAGLAVAAVVLTGWPDQPDRVLLDERAVLADLAGVPVHTLGRGDPPGDWDVAAWLDVEAPRTAPPGPPTPGVPQTHPSAPRAEVVLEPYRAWEERPMGDPRTTPRPRIMEAILEIVAAEGPMRATRAYALYNRAAGGKKLTTIARAPLSSSVYWLAQERKVVLTRRDEIPWQDDDLVRLPDAPAVHVRELGTRTLEEVPLDEIAELMRRLRTAHGMADAEPLKRAVLSSYGLVRLTARADEYLGLALGLMD